MSVENKEIVHSLADQLSAPSVQMLEKYLGESGVLDMRPVATMGSSKGGSGLSERVRGKIARSDPDSYSRTNMESLRDQMLKTLDRQLKETNSRVNLMYTVMVGMFVFQFAVLLGGVVLTLRNLVTVSTLQAVVGLSPGLIGGFAQFFYRNERRILETMDKDRSALFRELMKVS